MRRPRRLPRKTVLVLAVLAGLLALPHPAHAAAVQAAGPRQDRPAAVRTVAAVTRTAAASRTAASGGLCSVPGIGDIGGLLGFCAAGSSGLTGDLNNICQPSLPDPEPANSGIDSLIRPPASPGPVLATPYNEYGVAGQYWAATKLQCSDMTSLIGNNVAGMVFDLAKSIDRVTITLYQAAAGEGILSWLRNAADKLITSLGNAIYFPYLAIVVIIGAIWLAWQGLIRKRGSRTIEGTVWMVIACAAAIWLIGRPADFTGVGKGVSDGISQALNVAFAKLPSPGQSSCLPVRRGDPQIQPSSYSYTAGSTVVDQNANELWTVLVCKPWLDGEFGTTTYSAPGGKPTPVNIYGRQLLWSQALAVNEKPTTGLIQAKQATYAGIAASLQQRYPAVYPLFQGNQWTSRLEIAFAALLAAVVAGVLVLLISVTLILLKLGFLLLLIVGPFFLLIGTHPGFGRVVALRWVEMLIGVLLKQAAVALVLSVLLYCYALIMGTSDAVLPWALKILMISLVTVAAFIYRKPFQHLFSAVGYGVIGSRERAELDLSRAAATARGNTTTAATIAVPAFAGYRVARWARRNPGQAASLAVGAAAGGASAATAAGLSGRGGGAQAEDLESASGSGAENAAAGADSDGAPAAAGAGRTARARARAAAAAEGGSRDEPPPLTLPARPAAAGVPPAWNRSKDAAGSAPAAAGAAAAGAVPAAAGRPGTSRTGDPARPAGGTRAGRPVWPGSPARSAGAPARGPAQRPAGGTPARPADPLPGRAAAAAGGPPAAPAARQPAAPVVRQPAPRQPSAPQPSTSPGRQPAVPPGRQPAAPSARQPAAREPRAPVPVRQPAARPAPVRQPAAARPAAPPARQLAAPAARSAGPFAARSVPSPGRPSGPWSGRPAGPAQRPGGLPPERPAPAREAPAGPAGPGGQRPGGDAGSAAGAPGSATPEAPAPFWLKSIWRRK